jgi:DNA-binding FrmR family transcriptional regulator
MATRTTPAAARRAAAPPAPETTGCDREMMPPDKRDEALKRLARASGQVAGISRMIDDGRHCTEVLQQIAAVQKALDGVGNIVMRNYLERCVTTAIEGGDPTIYDELMTVLTRYR